MDKECKNFREQFEAFLAGKLSESERKEIERHLASCDACRGEFEMERKLEDLLRSLERQPAPEALRHSVMKQLESTVQPRKSLLTHIKKLITPQRLPVIAGAATVIILLFVGVRLLHPPAPMKSTQVPSSVKEQPRSLATNLKPFVTESTEPALSEDKKFSARAGVEAIDESKSPVSELGAARAPLAHYAHIEELLKKFGAIAIKTKAASKKSPELSIAFLIPEKGFEDLKKRVKRENIRIVKVEKQSERLSLIKVRGKAKTSYFGDRFIPPERHIESAPKSEALQRKLEPLADKAKSAHTLKAKLALLYVEIVVTRPR